MRLIRWWRLKMVKLWLRCNPDEAEKLKVMLAKQIRAARETMKSNEITEGEI